MQPKNVERITALSFLFIGLSLLIFVLTLGGVKIPFFGIVILIGGIAAVIASFVLFADSGSQQQI